MNSFNHYSFGAVASWMCMYSFGIKREQYAPGFTEFTLCPVPDPDGVMTFAKGYCDTVSGRIKSSWERTEGGMRYCLTVPAGTAANLRLPAEETSVVSEGGKPAEEAEGVTEQGYSDGRRCYRILSGRYEFVVE